ncbi:MAG: RagB/SusD family nutrient uptake outer membrane protein [Chitinophagaceae bacterium]|nr:RagB/SusD family nutrient uptake outer membrane protein [Chitinophagaceae bacterium]
MHLPAVNRTIFVFCLLLLMGSVSCKKFLSTYSQNKSFVESADDLDEVLVGEGYENITSNKAFFLHIMDDDAALGKPAGGFDKFLLTGFHFWQSDPWIDNQGTVIPKDVFFIRMYERISRLNIILFNVPIMRDKGEPAAKLQRISGEAHFLRAYYYFMLMNYYGKPWHQSTAASDFAVPIKIESPVDDKFFSRSTIKQVYDQIVADLTEAEKELETFNATTPKRANLAAVQGLLSRVWLYQEEYGKAISYADKLLGNQRYKMSDLNQYVAGSDFNTLGSPETIFTMGEAEISTLMSLDFDQPNTEFYQVSDDLAAIYSGTDLRLNAFYKPNSKGVLRCVKANHPYRLPTDVSDTWLIRISEICLNKAEALAMLGRDQEAINTIQELRKLRFKPADLTTISATGEALVNFIRDERRRELSFENHRWFDLRRYANNAKYPFSKTIRHDSYSYGPGGYYKDGYYELKPYDQDRAAYIIPIYREEIEFNSGSLKNEDRPQRSIKH